MKDKNKTKTTKGTKDQRSFHTKRNYNKNSNSGSDVENSTNDVAWYKKNPGLVEAVANIAFSNFPGLDQGPDQIPDLLLGGSYYKPRKAPLPGILRIGMLPTFGVSTDASSDLNIISRRVYSFIRSKNSGARNYEAPDYMTYLLAMSSIYAWYAELCRLYGLMRTYSNTNRYYVRPIIEALGYDYNDIANHMADLRLHIGILASKVNSFAIPKDLAIYDRHAWPVLNVFKDQESNRAQFYVMQYDSLYAWSGTQFSTGSALIPVNAGGSFNDRTFNDITKFSTRLVDELMGNEDIGTMSGDTLHAYGESGLRVLSMIPEDFTVTPVYDPIALAQIQHIRTHDTMPKWPHMYASTSGGAEAGYVVPNAPYPYNDLMYNNWCVRQHNNVLLFTPVIRTRSQEDFNALRFTPTVLNAHSDAPSPDYVMEASRFMFTVRSVPFGDAIDVYDEDACCFPITSCAAQLVTSMTLFTLPSSMINAGATGYSTKLVPNDVWTDIIVPTGSIQHPSSVLSHFGSYKLAQVFLNMWNYAPLNYVMLWNTRANDAKEFAIFPIGHLDNWTYLEPSRIQKLNNVAMMSLLAVPGMGKLT